MAFPIQELFHLVAGKNSSPPRESFKASSIRITLAARFRRQERPLSNKGVGHSGTTRNSWENICPSQQQRSAQVNIFVIVFPVAPKMVQVYGEKALEQEVRTE